MITSVAAGDESTTILMVEDDPGHARLIEKNLRRAGVHNELIQFESGRTLIDYLLAETPPPALSGRALVLLDLNLPDMDGYEVLHRIRTEPRTKVMTVIVLTTTDNPEEVHRCYELGCNIYITKPVEYEQFADAIKKLGSMLSIVQLPQ